MQTMISIIICSRTADISDELKQNIATTIGCEYELCVIDNSRNEYSIFTAYNEGVRRAMGDILCFMHDDILFHTDGWGEKLSLYMLNHAEVGAIGFLGGHYLPQRPCSWNEPRIESVHYIQGEMVNGKYLTREILHQKYRKERTFVAAIDGVFMAIPRCHFTNHKLQWDDKSYSGFHFYDVDMCMQIHQLGLKIEIVWDILIEHKSCGNTGAAFLNARQIWFEKWKHCLPMVCGIELTEEDKDICRIIMDITDQSYQYHQILHSKAYRLGKVLLHPSWINIKRLFSKI